MIQATSQDSIIICDTIQIEEMEFLITLYKNNIVLYFYGEVDNCDKLWEIL